MESSPVSAADRMKKLRQFKLLRAVVQEEELPGAQDALDNRPALNSTIEQVVTEVNQGDDLLGDKFDVLVEAEVLDLDMESTSEENITKEALAPTSPMQVLLNDFQNNTSGIKYNVLASVVGKRKISGVDCNIKVAHIAVPSREDIHGPMHVLQVHVTDLAYIKEYTLHESWAKAVEVAQGCIDAMIFAGLREPGLLMNEVKQGHDEDVFWCPDGIACKEEDEKGRGVLFTLLKCFKLQSLEGERRKKHIIMSVPFFKKISKKPKRKNSAWGRRQTRLKEISKPYVKVVSDRRESTRSLSLEERIKIDAEDLLKADEIISAAAYFRSKEINGFVCDGWVCKTSYRNGILASKAEDNSVEEFVAREEMKGEDTQHYFALAKVEEDRGRTFMAKIPWEEATAMLESKGMGDNDQSTLYHVLDLLALKKESIDRRRLYLAFEKIERKARKSVANLKRKKSSTGKRKTLAGRVLSVSVRALGGEERACVVVASEVVAAVLSSAMERMTNIEKE